MAGKSAKTTAFTMLLAIVLGILYGRTFPEWALKGGEIGNAVIRLIKVFATPLVLFAILEALVKYTVKASDFGRMLFLAMINAVFALAIGLFVANIFQPGLPLRGDATQTVSGEFGQFKIIELLMDQVPKSIIHPLSDNNILSLALVVILIALALKKLSQEGEDHFLFSKLTERLVSYIYLMRKVFEKVLRWVAFLIPFAVFEAIGRVVAKNHGSFGEIQHWINYALLCLLAFSLHSVFVYLAWVKLYAKVSLRKFFQEGTEPLIYAFGVNSSLVTLPLTLKALDNLGVSRAISTLVSCIGTNFNHVGIILYEVFTVLTFAQAYGLDLSMTDQLTVAGFCLIASIGVSGVPEAGIVALTLVLHALKLPDELIPTLFAVDWILARTRSLVNTLGDLCCSITVEKMVNKDSFSGLSLNRAHSGEA